MNRKAKAKDESPEENLLKENNPDKSKSNPISPHSSDETADRKAKAKDENPEETLLKENNPDKCKSNPNSNNDATSPPSSSEAVDRKVTVEDEKPEESLLKEKQDENGTNSNNDANGETVEITIPQKKKKKKKKKKKSGDDDNYLDFHDSGPREEDEDKLYDPSKPLTYRIEVAVQKYKKNRKFNSTRNQVFSSYLRFGGISTGQKSFLGQDGVDNADADAEEIAMRRATDFIDDDKVDDMEVNFTYIVRVYLSSFIIDRSGYVQMDQFREGPHVVISFLNYLFTHKVCPEYEEDMQEALKLAHKAKEELPNCKSLAQNAPGKINKACSLLFGGELYGMLDEPWDGEVKVANMIGISKEEGKRLIKELFGDNAFEELTQMKEDSRSALKCEIIGVESFQTEAFTNETHQIANGEGPVVNNESQSNKNTQETNLKKIVLRELREHDVSDVSDVSTAESFYICVNSDIGNYAMPGMRITADFHKLSNGFWYWDKVTNVYPSYYHPCEDDSDDDY
ncbi:Argonaute siRNA chaperone complex subunit Arb1-domain-containing protein [Glomus cerebriforme]|uniref:Argonaute siRNA chaperone complex subunit Arb1-domain-containing protein n=1 Tax=Glomus cerebriforme TaxID=658196 RepID=A0A397T8V9_9GLOM|nr:Argonaute siRNA chaperone complex subunit Arb1-domain-containing protein [Glomus cerebriforme]